MEKKELKTYTADEIRINKNTQEHWEKTLQYIEKLDGWLLIEEGDFKLEHIREVTGGVEVGIDSSFTAPALTVIGGCVIIQDRVNFTAPALTRVGGFVSVYENAGFMAPALTKIEDYVYVYENASFTTPVLTEIGNSVFVTESASFTAPALTVIGGDIDISGNAGFVVPALTKIGGYFYVPQNSSFMAPALTEIGEDVVVRENARFTAPELTEIGGAVFVGENAGLTVPALTSIGGNVEVRTKLSPQTESILWKAGAGREWYLTDQCSDFLLSQTGNIEYFIGGIAFDKQLFDAIRNDTLSAREVFQIPILEQRRVAFERLDKSKMAELDYTVLDEKVDEHGNPMRLISFTIDGYEEPFLYLHCVCPSTKREYYLETNGRTCDEAKAASFGLDDAEFTAEG